MKNTNYLHYFYAMPSGRWLFSTITFCCLFFYSGVLSAQGDLNDCNSFHCWPKTYLTGGILECSGYVVNKDEFANLDNWYTHLYSDPNHPTARIHKPCAESFFLDKNVIIDNGCTILGLHEPNTHLTAVDPNNSNQTVEYVRDFTAGTIYSKGQYHFGKFEAEIEKMPGHGWWPAFWMWHHEEIDIMERFNESFFIYNSYPSTICDDSGSFTPQTSIYNDGPHIFGMEWTPFKVTFFYNHQPLPKVIYRYYGLDGIPLDIECGDNIPQGFYYQNPAFILPWRDVQGDNGIEPEGTWFSPIIGMGVLPLHGYDCCGTNTFCGDPGCDGPCNGDWGNPFNADGTPKPNFDANTELKINYVEIGQQDYNACDAVGITFPEKVCVGDNITVVIEALGGTDAWHIINASFGALHLLTDQGGNNAHEKYLRAASPGIGEFELLYTNQCGAQKVFKGLIKIEDGRECGFDPCAANQTGADDHCCPPNSIFDGANCFYGYVPDNAYSPFLQNNTLYAIPNCTINTNNDCCPPGYQLQGGRCNSGITVPPGYSAFIFENGLYAEKNCDDVRDCCPFGYEFDGANCYSGVSFPAGYTPFIYGSSFYVQPNCAIMPNDNHCCPAGYEWDGANCYSGLDIPSGYNGFIFENSFYVEPKCDEIEDCCPVGSSFDGYHCNFYDAPGGYSGFVHDHTFYVTPHANNECPDGYFYDGIGCNSGTTFPAGFEGFMYGNTFYTHPHCPGDIYNEWTVNQISGCPNFRFLVQPTGGFTFPAGTVYEFTVDDVIVAPSGSSVIIPYTSIAPGEHTLCVSVTVPGHGLTKRCITFVNNCVPWTLDQLTLCPRVGYRVTAASWYNFPQGTTYSYTMDGVAVAGSGSGFLMWASQLSIGFHTICATVHVPGQAPVTKCSTFYNNCGLPRNVFGDEPDFNMDELEVSTLVSTQITFSRSIVEGEAVLYASNGDKVAQFPLNNTDRINVEKIPSGAYMLQVIIGGEVHPFRIVKVE